MGERKQRVEDALATAVSAAKGAIFGAFLGTIILETIPTPAFGSGAMHSSARRFDPPNEVGSLVATALLFALVRGGLFKIGEKFSKPRDKDAYNKTRSLLSSLGLQNYERDFKKGLLTDNTFICSLTGRALREVRIPPGPRLLIHDGEYLPRHE